MYRISRIESDEIKFKLYKHDIEVVLYLITIRETKLMEYERKII